MFASGSIKKIEDAFAFGPLSNSFELMSMLYSLQSRLMLTLKFIIIVWFIVILEYKIL